MVYPYDMQPEYPEYVQVQDVGDGISTGVGVAIGVGIVALAVIGLIYVARRY